MIRNVPSLDEKGGTTWMDLGSFSSMALPFLPGNSRSTNLEKERFHKSQHFTRADGVPMLVGAEKPGIGGQPLVGQRVKPKCSVEPEGKDSDLPSWVAFDKQALCFDAYFQEAASDVQQGGTRIRKCKIYFYPEDDTIKVVEPACKNSGIPQGTLLRRHRIPLPPPNQEDFYNVYHFNVNQQVVLYSRTFTVTDCDPFTRNFLTNQGVVVNAPAEMPADPYSNLREQLEESLKPLRPYERRDTLRQFLDHDGQVLRFSCFWDDTESTFGDLRELVLQYYLVDDTIEILEIVPPNAGRDAVPKFLRRDRLPKHPSAQMKLPGQITARTVLNVFDSDNQGSRYLLDNRKTGALQEDFYQDCDLTLGGEVNVMGRRVILTDCDDFTKDYYRSKYGIEDFTPVQYTAAPAPRPPRPPRPVPPYNGFGSEEDSLRSCMGLLPKPPQKDFHKFMLKDSVLNFLAKMVTTDPIDQERVFNISFHLCDDSMSVFERPQKNSGLTGGKFLQRCRVKKPGQELFKSEFSECFTAQDLFIGATLCLRSKNFRILDADEYTLNYMKEHSEEFPKANVGNILSKLRSVSAEKQTEIRKFLTLSDPSNSGSIPYDSFRSLLIGLDCGLCEHEALVLGRCFSERSQPEADVGLMLAVAQDLLRRKDFDQFPHMLRSFSFRDRQKTGRLSTDEMRTICKGIRLPLSENLLQGLLRKFADADEVDYQAFVAGINWTEHPAAPVMPEDVLKFDVYPKCDVDGAAVNTVNYSGLLKDVFTSLPGSSNPPTATATAE